MTNLDPAGLTPEPGVASDATIGEPVARWRIQPEPTDEELVALVTVLGLARRRAAPASPPSPGAGGSRWARAGRVAALVPWSRAPGNGWGRGGPGQGGA